MWVSVSVKNGSVNAGLCKLNSTTVHTSKTVAYGSEALPDTDTISVFEGDRLGVRGMDSINKYRLDGRWGVVTFGATAPSENTRACNG